MLVTTGPPYYRLISMSSVNILYLLLPEEGVMKYEIVNLFVSSHDNRKKKEKRSKTFVFCCFLIFHVLF